MSLAANPVQQVVAVVEPVGGCRPAGVHECEFALSILTTLRAPPILYAKSDRDPSARVLQWPRFHWKEQEVERFLVGRMSALLLVLGFVLAGCGGASSSGAPTAKSPFKLAAILTLTGASAIFGQYERDGAQAAAAAINKAGGINGHPVELVVEDDAQNPNNAVLAFSRFATDDSVLALFGDTFGSATLAIAPLAQKAGIPILAPNATYSITHVGNPYIFRVAVAENVEVDALAQLVKKRGYKRIGLLYSTDAYGQQGHDLITTSPLINVVDSESFALAATDLTAQLTRVKSANPDALVLWDSGPAVGIGIKDATQLGMDLPIFSGLSANSPGNIAAANGVAELNKWLLLGLLDPKNLLPRQKVGFEAIKSSSGYDPTLNSAIGWDAVYLFAQALMKGADNPTRQDVSNGLEKVTNYQGMGGVYTYTKNGHDGANPDSMIWLKAEGDTFTTAAV
jgi:branched-chain amino acid transport system substrate-binding protein